ncbi:MAG: nuclear transport factor 2 family protein [Actinobacteria bacterium]|nr:nuclear transport factor 2 family protein [Actinomycetota bacterium]
MSTVPLPAVIATYLDAHDRHDTDASLAAFAPDAIVVDDGQTARGLDQIRAWLDGAASEYTFTRELRSATEADGGWLVVNHLEGDFPGGQVDLSYRFVVADGLISELVIAP